MNYTTIVKKGEGFLLWIYKNITYKFTSIFSKLQDRFPFINRTPLLKYSLIPLVIVLFVLLRYVLKLGLNELATWSTNFVGETSGVMVSEKVIVLSIAAMVIILRIGLRLRSQKKKKSNELELNYEHKK